MIQHDMSYAHNLRRSLRDIDLEFALLWPLASVRTTPRRNSSHLLKVVPKDTRIRRWRRPSLKGHRLASTSRRRQRNKRSWAKPIKRIAICMKGSQQRGWNTSIANSVCSIITEHHVYTLLARYLVPQPQQESQAKPSQPDPYQRNSALVLHRPRPPRELPYSPEEYQVPSPALHLFAGGENETKVADSSTCWTRLLVHLLI